MANCLIKPIPKKYFSIPKRLRPVLAPIFDVLPGDNLQASDFEVAIALFDALDEDSKRYYLEARPNFLENLERARREAVERERGAGGGAHGA